ncbi:putative tRNA selenocysteine 1-associated protein [Naja naja]|nr:putative tRNA selenocysteine 1-associated protein [Naja naja]
MKASSYFEHVFSAVQLLQTSFSCEDSFLQWLARHFPQRLLSLMGGGGRDGTPGFCQGKGEYGEITEQDTVGKANKESLLLWWRSPHKKRKKKSKARAGRPDFTSIPSR